MQGFQFIASSPQIYTCVRCSLEKANAWPSQTQTRSDDHILLRQQTCCGLLCQPKPALWKSHYPHKHWPHWPSPLAKWTFTLSEYKVTQLECWEFVHMSTRSKTKLQYNGKHLSLKTATFFLYTVNTAPPGHIHFMLLSLQFKPSVRYSLLFNMHPLLPESTFPPRPKGSLKTTGILYANLIIVLMPRPLVVLYSSDLIMLQ